MSGFLERDAQHMPLGRLVALTGQCLSRHWQRSIAERTPFSHTALVALNAIAEGDGITHREVAEQCWIQPATLTPVVDALEFDGLLSRQRDTVDRRVVRLHITPEGTESLRQARQEIGAEFRDIVPDVAAEDDSLIRKYLLTILNGLNEREDRRDACS